MGTVFLLTDAQVPDEKFLVAINDLLALGEIPELFADDELENVINGIHNEVKGAKSVLLANCPTIPGESYSENNEYILSIPQHEVTITADMEALYIQNSPFLDKVPDSRTRS